MWKRIRSKRVWFTSSGAFLDAAIAALPWLYCMGIYFWARDFGPNAVPPWPIGNPQIYEWCSIHVAVGFGIGVVIFAGVRFVIHRRNLLFLIAALASSALSILVTTSLQFA